MLQRILDKYVGYVVAINATDPNRLETCGLKAAGGNFFSVVTQNDLLIHVPYSRLISIVENNKKEPLKISKGFGSVSAQVVIYVEHMLVEKGSTGLNL